MSDDENQEEKDFYINYKDYCLELKESEKQIRKQLAEYKTKTKENSSCINLEKDIKKNLQNYKDLVDKLDDAYKEKNTPSGYPFQELDRRQKEIQQFGINYNKMQQELNSNMDDKYRFKGMINEDYNEKEEYKYRDTGDLLKLEKKKIDNQNKQIEEITMDVKKNTALAKNAKHVIKEQNKKLELISEDIERTDERMNSLTDRFKNYVSGMSWCRITVILVIEIALAILAFIFFLD